MLRSIIDIGLSMESHHYLKGALISTILLISGFCIASLGGFIILFSWDALEVSFLKWGTMTSGMALVFAGVIMAILSQYFPREE